MNKTIFGVILVGLMASGAANAADMRRSAPYYQAPQAAYYNWAGAYAGANVGYQWGKAKNTGTNPSGLEGGLQLGYNWQNGQFVFGAETDLQISGADDTFAPFKFSNPWFGTLRGRAGLAMNNILFYGTLGLAYGGLKAESFGLSEDKTHIGWTGGVGMEVGFNQQWSGKIEYLYADLSSRAYSVTGNQVGLSTSILRVGVNYHF
ncbi:MAG: porin family protein [Pseudolabrys sp.]|nr:porin family protein [Pseudolabrys sp.]